MLFIGAVFFLFFTFIFSPLEINYPENSGTLYSAEEELLAYTLTGDGQWRFKLLEKELPSKLVTSLLELEDQRFYFHPGLDPLALTRAAWQNLRSGHIVSGGSTITMQVARLLLKNHQRSYLNKIIETGLALRLEANHSKEEILRIYFQLAPYGGNIVGLETASWFYFHRPPKRLSWAEAALLAALPQKPSSLRLDKNRKHLLEVRNRLLKKLLRNGHLDEQDLSLALREPLPEKVRRPHQESPLLLQSLLTSSDHKSFRTSLNFEIQKSTGAILDSHMKNLPYSHINNAALVVFDTHSGKPLAFHGNNTKFESSSSTPTNGYFVNTALGSRSSGSTLKPFLYASMIDEGLLHSHMLLLDIPTWINGFHPRNFSKKYLGAIMANKALARSLNIPAVRMLQEFGAERFHSDLLKLKLTTFTRAPSQYGMSLILGGGETNLFELTRAYNLLAQTAHGREKVILSSLTGDVTEIESPFSVGASFLTLEALLDVRRPESGINWKQFSSSQRISWKTGTSHGFRDAWSIGTNGKYTVGVWMGNASGEGRPEIIGTKLAAPLMFSVFNLLKNSSWFDFPEIKLKQIRVCKNSGMLPTNDCIQHMVWIPEDSFFSVTDKYNTQVTIDKTTNLQAHQRCRTSNRLETKTIFTLPEKVRFFLKNSSIRSEPLPLIEKDCVIDQELKDRLAMIYPRHKSQLILGREIDGLTQPVVFQASHSDPKMILHWHLNQKYLGKTKGDHLMELSPQPGEYKLTLVDQSGLSHITEFEVIR